MPNYSQKSSLVVLKCTVHFLLSLWGGGVGLGWPPMNAFPVESVTLFPEALFCAVVASFRKCERCHWGLLPSCRVQWKQFWSWLIFLNQTQNSFIFTYNKTYVILLQYTLKFTQGRSSVEKGNLWKKVFNRKCLTMKNMNSFTCHFGNAIVWWGHTNSKNFIVFFITQAHSNDESIFKQAKKTLNDCGFSTSR